ncbi:MAG TPA: hypothetical protein VN766_17925 [Stellaceae bacterium]|jgi:hypothetical protein|nr:hypothetical protein [Stellaceae bacterium]
MSSATRLLAALALLGLALAPGQAGAETAAAPPQLAVAPANLAGEAAAPAGYRGLPPSDRKIVHALFEAQHPTAEGAPPLNLDQIAALKAKSGWEPAFRHMRAAGLLLAKSLRQVIGVPARPRRPPARRTDGMAASTGGALP